MASSSVDQIRPGAMFLWERRTTVEMTKFPYTYRGYLAAPQKRSVWHSQSKLPLYPVIIAIQPNLILSNNPLIIFSYGSFPVLVNVICGKVGVEICSLVWRRPVYSVKMRVLLLLEPVFCSCLSCWPKPPWSDRRWISASTGNYGAIMTRALRVGVLLTKRRVSAQSKHIRPVHMRNHSNARP
jgi:hypothetical protein